MLSGSDKKPWLSCMKTLHQSIFKYPYCKSMIPSTHVFVDARSYEAPNTTVLKHDVRACAFQHQTGQTSISQSVRAAS